MNDTPGNPVVGSLLSVTNMFRTRFTGLFGIAFALGAYATPASHCHQYTTPTATHTPSCDIQICYDNVNECGIGFGGCFLAPQCGGPPTPTFTTPPCPSTTTNISHTSSCSFSICVDGVNECGIRFGGCYLAPQCGGTPNFTRPPCPTTTSITQTCNNNICVDKVNECGMWFGGCYLAPECGGTVPTFTPPPCPTTTS